MVYLSIPVEFPVFLSANGIFKNKYHLVFAQNLFYSDFKSDTVFQFIRALALSITKTF